MSRDKQLQIGARTADALVYIVGLAGVAAGGLLLRDGQAAFAVVAWALTFCAGAALRLLATMARSIAEILVRVRATGERLDAARPSGGGHDDRWGRLH